MKFKITLVLVSLLILSACSPENEEYISSDSSDFIIEIGGGTSPDPTSSVCTTTTDLIAGQNTVVGTVTLTYDPATQTYTVTYTTDNGWELEETHVWIGDCENRPANNPGNPLVGHFPYADNHSAGTTTFSYNLDAVTEGLNTVGCYATHAVVNGPNGQNETAWGDGLPYGGNSWAMYMEYDFSTCQ